MKRRRGPGRIVAAALLLSLGGCDALRLGFLNAAGPVAGGERHLFIIVSIVLVFVIGPVLLLTPIIAWYYRLSNKNSVYRPEWEFSWPLEGLIWIPPVGIVIGLAFLLWTDTHRYDPYRPIRSSLPTIEVQAVGLDWKWLFIYPDRGIATVNQLAIPVGQPVHLSLTSGTVMQSLFVPQLAGQIYAMAGMTTQLNLAADRPGTFIGENTQFNGNGFQQQKFAVVAMSPGDYAQWLERVRRSAQPLDAAAYAQLFKKSAPASPIFYSSVPPRLFQNILAKSRAGTPEATR
ncbi:MAG TPA: COX aromatic rich motif-containing protein [Candidatus Binataceae bacterium]|nr:COX aromatic rich motif-containing protein [Candidatus Binataceae bacterium]